jgi:hypothetical protein
VHTRAKGGTEEGGYHTHGLGCILKASAPKELAISERKIFVKWSSNAPIICFDTSNALSYHIRTCKKKTYDEVVSSGCYQTWKRRRGCSRWRLMSRARSATAARAI